MLYEPQGDINEMVAEALGRGAPLIDVRTPDEYAEAHIPGSVNLPAEEIARIGRIAPDPDAPVYLYCHSGARADRAAVYLDREGYAEVIPIGGIIDWKGPMEKGAGQHA